jgi:hypothetical protein
VELQAERSALQGRDDLASQDRRAALDLAWRNRSPEDVGDDVSAVPAEHREEEAALRRAWRAEHVAWSWDNLDPDAQIDPRPPRLSLSWLLMAWHLPAARNGAPFHESWVSDYFARKRWYRPVQGPLRLSMVDQVQRESVQKELDALSTAEIRAHLNALPLDGMSPEEAQVERKIARTLLSKREVMP